MGEVGELCLRLVVLDVDKHRSGRKWLDLCWKGGYVS